MEAIETRLRDRVPRKVLTDDTESLVARQNECSEPVPPPSEAHRSNNDLRASDTSFITNIQLYRPENSLLEPPSPSRSTRSCTTRRSAKNLGFLRKATKCLPHFGQGSRRPTPKEYSSLDGSGDDVEESDFFANAGEVSTFVSTVTAATTATTSQKHNEVYSPLCWNELELAIRPKQHEANGKHESNCKIVISRIASDCSSLGVSKSTQNISGSTADASSLCDSDRDSSIYMLDDNLSDNDEGYDTSGISFETSALSPSRSSWVRFHELGCWCVD